MLAQRQCEHKCAELAAGAHTRLVLTAGYDPLADEGLAYAKKLEQSGVSVTVVHMSDQMHGFLTMGKIVRAADTALEISAAALRRGFAKT
jgi:acetyl esterase